MSQHINLYNAALLPRRHLLSARNLVLLMVLVAGLAGAAGWHARAGADRQAALTAQGRQAVEHERERLTQLVKARNERQPDAGLAAELKRAEALLATRQALELALPARDAVMTNGFSEHFRAFARQTMEGVWLVGFSIDGASGAMEIDGRAVSPELVPVYIRRLTEEPAFHGRSFAALDVKRLDPPARADAPKAADAARFAAQHPDDPGHVRFLLGSTRSEGSRP